MLNCTLGGQFFFNNLATRRRSGTPQRVVFLQKKNRRGGRDRRRDAALRKNLKIDNRMGAGGTAPRRGVCARP